jgi:hypothetical protein
MWLPPRRVLRGVARVCLCALGISVTSCGDAPAAAVVVDPDDAATLPLTPVDVGAGLAGPVELHVQTYVGSEEVVHPDVVRIAGGLGGFEYWMTIDPYPGGSESSENASIYASNDGVTWVTPGDLTNPVSPLPAGEINYNSDPDILYLADARRLVLFDRAVTPSSNLIRQYLSDDGVHWSAPVTVLEGPRHELVSPAIVIAPGHRPRLFVVNTGNRGCNSRVNYVDVRRWSGSRTGATAAVGRGWGAPVRTGLEAPDRHIIWHIDVTWVESRQEYWAVFPAYASDASCSTNDLYIARSRDGVSWTTLAQPLIARTDAPFVAKTLYRSSLVWNEASGLFQVWFTGVGDDDKWHLGYQAFPVVALAGAFDAQAAAR